MKISFNGVEAAKTEVKPSKVIVPGVQELKIISVEEKTAGTGKAYLEVHMNKPENPVEYPLRPRFYLTAAALPRLMYFLQEVLGKDLSGTEIDTSELSKELIGKVNTYVVNGEEFLKPNDNGGAPYKNVRADLAFRDFVNPAEGATHYVKPLVSVEDTTAQDAGSASGAEDDDLPF